ncbi:MAG: hypothetical protein ACYDDT_00700 [Sulfuricella sp.]
MAQNLPAPCFQVYAASVLASRPFRQADLAVRGLIHTMELECWVNHRLPHDSADLAKFLGIAANEITAALPAAMAFFNIDGEGIFSPRLEDYRQHLNEIRAKQKTGGKKGAALTNKRKGLSEKRADNAPESDTTNPQVYPQVEARVSSKAQYSKTNQSQNQSPERAVITDPFVAEYEAAENCTADAYAKASGGG